MRPIRHVPYRLKILATVLFLVTTVVSLITFTMARMFHADKSAYVADLVSVAATHAAREADVVLGSYRDRLQELGRVLDDSDLPARKKTAMMEETFSSIPGCLAIRVFEGGSEVGSLADTSGAEAGSLVRQVLRLPIGGQLSGLRRGGEVAILRALDSTDPPTIILAVSVTRSSAGPPLVLAGILDVTRALDLGGNRSAFDVFLLDRSGKALAHSDPKQDAGTNFQKLLPPLSTGSQVIVQSYRIEGTEMVGGFARVGIGDLRAAAQIPKSAAFFASRQLLSTLILVAFVLLLVAALASLFWSAQLTRSLARLAQATRVIAGGKFDVHVAVKSRDEMGQLAESFNHMAAGLHEREQALRHAQAQLVQSEKMAAFGQLGAGIAHEVKNPLAGIQGIVQLTTSTLEENDPMRPHLAIIEKETKRCRAIIDNLLRFARQEKMAREPTALPGIANDTAALMRHQMSLHKVELKVDVPESLPKALASGNQIQQVLMNLLLNAEQAMESRGHGAVTLGAREAGDGFVELFVQDDGPGIPDEIQARIFEPFFTTKPPGKGTGLGLSVTYGIIRDHGGSIRIDSEVGKGTTFIIRLPVAGDPDAVSRVGGGTVRPALGKEDPNAPYRSAA